MQPSPRMSPRAASPRRVDAELFAARARQQAARMEAWVSEAPPAMSPGTLAKTQEHIRRTAALMAEAPPSPPGPPPLAPIKATETLPAEMP